MASHDEQTIVRVTVSRRRPVKLTAHHPVERTRHISKIECTEDANGTIVQRGPHCRKLKSRRAKQHNDTLNEKSSGSKSREKCAVKKRRRASVPMLRTSVITRHEGVAAADTPERVRSQDVAPSRMETSGSTLLRSNQSEKWQQAMLRKHQSTLRGGVLMSELQLKCSGSSGVTRPRGQQVELKQPEARDITKVMKTSKKGNATKLRLNARTASKVDSATAAPTKVLDGLARPCEKAKSASHANDVATDQANRARRHAVGRKMRPRVAASEPLARRKKVVGTEPAKLVRQKVAAKTTRLTVKEKGGRKTTSKGANVAACV